MPDLSARSRDNQLPAAPPCPHCRGTGGDPEDEGDWISEAHRHNPYSAGPCPQCNGRGTVTEQDAAASLARECTDYAAVILWCADRVRSVDASETVQDAADYLHSLSTRAQVDADPDTDRAAVIRWCAQQIHSMGGDAEVERAAEYLDDLATEAAEREEKQ